LACRQRLKRIMRVYLRSVERETRMMRTSGLDVLDGDAD